MTSVNVILHRGAGGWYAYPWGPAHTGFGPFGKKRDAEKESAAQIKKFGPSCPLHRASVKDSHEEKG